MKPMVIIPPDVMSDEDITLLRENGICVVVCKEPDAVRFVDAIPEISSRTEIQAASIELSRFLLSPPPGSQSTLYRSDIIKTFCDILMRGEPLRRVVPVQAPKKKAGK